MTEQGNAVTHRHSSKTRRGRFPRILGLTRNCNTGSCNHSNNANKTKTVPGSDLKEIGLWYGGSLVMNAIVGLGIFGTPKGVLAEVGSVGMTLVIWTFTGIFSMFAALCFVELRESVRKEGVEYAYITEAFGPLAGFVYSWMRIAAAEPAATALFAMVFSDYVTDSIYDGCGPPNSLLIMLSNLAILSMCLVNVISIKLSEKVQTLATLGKTCALIAIVVMGVRRISNGKLEIIHQGMTGTAMSQSKLVFACYNGLWAYGGWSQVNHVTSGIKKPPRNVPRIVKTVIPLVLLLYLAVILSYFTAMTQDDLLSARAIGVMWASRVLGPAQPIVSIGVCLAALGSLNATFLSAGRLSSVAARNRQMPDVASWIHVRSKTPLLVVSVKAVIAMLVVYVATVQECLRFYIFCVWLFHGMSVIALLVLRYKDKHKLRPYKVDLWIPVVVVIGTLYLLLVPFLQSPDREFIAVVVLIFLSLITYYPVEWLKAKGILHWPDKLTIWLQLFFRVAPKRELRREKRRSMIRRFLEFDNLLHPDKPDKPGYVFNRFASLRYPSKNQSDFGDFFKQRNTSNLRRRKAGSLSETDSHQLLTSNSQLSHNNNVKPMPNVNKKISNPRSCSFNHADVIRLPSPPSLSILKNRFSTTPVATENSLPGALASPSAMRTPLLPPDFPSSFTYPSYRFQPRREKNRNQTQVEQTQGNKKTEILQNEIILRSNYLPNNYSTSHRSNNDNDNTSVHLAEDNQNHNLIYDQSFGHGNFDRRVLFQTENEDYSSSTDDNDDDDEYDDDYLDDEDDDDDDNLEHTIFANLFDSDSSSNSSTGNHVSSDLVTSSYSDDVCRMEDNSSCHGTTIVKQHTDSGRYNVDIDIHSSERGSPPIIGFLPLPPSQQPPKPRKRLSLLRLQPHPIPRTYLSKSKHERRGISQPSLSPQPPTPTPPTRYRSRLTKNLDDMDVSYV